MSAKKELVFVRADGSVARIRRKKGDVEVVSSVPTETPVPEQAVPVSPVAATQPPTPPTVSEETGWGAVLGIVAGSVLAGGLLAVMAALAVRSGESD